MHVWDRDARLSFTIDQTFQLERQDLTFGFSVILVNTTKMFKKKFNCLNSNSDFMKVYNRIKWILKN